MSEKVIRDKKACEIAKIMNCAANSVNYWKSIGCPHEVKGKLAYYNENEVKDWLLENNSNILLKRKKKEKEIKEIKEIEEEIGEIKINTESLNSLSEAIKQINIMREKIYKLINNSLRDQDLGIANKLLQTFDFLVDNQRKAQKDEIEIQKQLGNLIPKSDSETFVSFLCESFRSSLYAGVNDITSNFIQICSSFSLIPEQGKINQFQNAIIENLNVYFDNLLTDLSKSYENYFKEEEEEEITEEQEEKKETGKDIDQ